MTEPVTSADLNRSIDAINNSVSISVSSVKDDINEIKDDVRRILKMQQEIFNQQNTMTFKIEEQGILLTKLNKEQDELKKKVDIQEPEIESLKEFRKNSLKLVMASFLSFFGALGAGAYSLVVTTPKPITVPLDAIKINLEPKK